MLTLLKLQTYYRSYNYVLNLKKNSLLHIGRTAAARILIWSAVSGFVYVVEVASDVTLVLV